MLEVKVSYDRDHERAVAECRFWAPLALPAEAKQGVDDPIELERLAARRPTSTPRAGSSSRATPRSRPSGSARYVDMGFRHLIFHSPAPDQDRFLKLFSAEVLPLAARGAAGASVATAVLNNGARHRYSGWHLWRRAEDALGGDVPLDAALAGFEVAERLALVLEGESVGVGASSSSSRRSARPRIST